MADHSQKWHDGSSSRNIEGSSNSEGITAIVRKLDNLGQDMKKLKENMHAIQVGCQNYEGAHLDKNCPLNEGVKSVKEAKYGEFERLSPFNLGVSVNVIPKTMFKHLKLAQLKKTNMLVEMADMTKRSPFGIVENVLVKIARFLFPSHFVVMDMLNTCNETMILGRPFLATIHAEIDVFNKEISLGIGGDRVITNVTIVITQQFKPMSLPHVKLLLIENMLETLMVGDTVHLVPYRTSAVAGKVPYFVTLVALLAQTGPIDKVPVLRVQYQQSCLRHHLQSPTLLSTPILNQGEYFGEPTRSYQMELHDPDFILEPIYPEYIPLEDEHILSTEEQPLPLVVSPTVESLGYVVESDPKQDPEEYEDDETKDGPVDYPIDGGDNGDDDDGNSSGDDADDKDKDEEDEKEEEEEHLAPANSAVIIPTDEFVAAPEGIEPVIPPPSTDTATTRARIIV
nr:hypothetical protein [Tanacetum cinerariifolium]